jgi:hypothetical protein
MLRPTLIARTSAVGAQRRVRMAVNMENVSKISKAITSAVEGYDIKTFKVEVTDEKIEVQLVAAKSK